jgi:hypothetical protein
MRAIMFLTNTLLASFLFCATGAAAPLPTERLAVHVNVAFDDSITSQAIRAAAMEEAATIWRIYGVDLQYAEPNADTALSLDVIVERTPQPRKYTGMPAILGHTTISSVPAAQAPLRISFDAVLALLDSQHGVNQLLHDYGIAAALGRVVAHEIGHVLLGSPAYHDAEGLMRTTFFPEDLSRPERSRFLLTHRSVARLRSRIAAITEAQTAGGGCGRENP